jgi:hypothetical protein
MLIEREEAVPSVPRHIGRPVPQPCSLAVLDIDFAQRTGAFPERPPR